MNYSRFIFGLAAAGAGAVSLLSMFGVLDGVSWIGDNLDTLLLLMVAVVLSALSALDHRLARVERHSEVASHRSLEDALRRIEATLPEEFRQLFSPFLDRWVTRLEEAIRSKTVRIEPSDQFPVFYVETLRSFPRENLLATSLPSLGYFWKNDVALQAMKEFIAKGGRITRIFFLDSPDVVEQEEAREIFLGQLAAKVHVISVQRKEIPHEWQRLFVVSCSKDLAWIVQTVAGSVKIESACATADSAVVKGLRRTFQSLVSHPSAREWFTTGDGALRSRRISGSGGDALN